MGTNKRAVIYSLNELFKRVDEMRKRGILGTVTLACEIVRADFKIFLM